jgi:very-short-patch-repair endonuclease
LRADSTILRLVTHKDRTRDDVLREMGIKVLRFSDRDVFENTGGVIERIWSCL